MTQDISENPKAVLITGTSTGIGRACSLHLDKLGFTVFAGVRKETDAEALKKQASKRLVPLIIDMNEGDSITEAFEYISSSSVGSAGMVGLVNNAGIPMGGPLEFVDLDNVRRGFEVNLMGHIRIIQTFLPLIRKQKGRIINIGSIGGIFPMPFVAPYNASKAAMHALTHTLRRELLPEGIHVSLIVPGNIKTAIWEKVQEDTIPVSLAVKDRYGQALQAMEKLTNKMGSSGIPAESVAKVVADALTRKRPKTQYVVGIDAKLQILAALLLPNCLLDRITLFAVGINGDIS